MDKWEYKTISFKADSMFSTGVIDTENFTETLNTYGKDGWEVVTCFDTNYGHGGSRYVYTLLKRRIA